MVDTVGDALPREMARIRDVVIPAYESIGPARILAKHADADGAVTIVNAAGERQRILLRS